MYTSTMGFDQYAVDSHGTEGTHTTLRKMIIFNIKRAHPHSHPHTHTYTYTWIKLSSYAAHCRNNRGKYRRANSSLLPFDVISTFINHERQMHSRMLAAAKVNFKGKLDIAGEREKERESVYTGSFPTLSNPRNPKDIRRMLPYEL